jgi:hypothetical protein
VAPAATAPAGSGDGGSGGTSGSYDRHRLQRPKSTTLSPASAKTCRQAARARRTSSRAHVQTAVVPTSSANAAGQTAGVVLAELRRRCRPAERPTPTGTSLSSKAPRFANRAESSARGRYLPETCFKRLCRIGRQRKFAVGCADEGGAAGTGGTSAMPAWAYGRKRH